MQAVCSGFVYALTVADAMIRAGTAQRALVVGSEIFSRLLDFNDRTTCVLFGDGAGAVVLEASDTPGILASDLHADGRHVGILCVPGHVSGGQVSGLPLLTMDGPAVFKTGCGVLESAARAALDKAGLTEADIDWLIPHQANIRIMQGTACKLKLSTDKMVVTVDQHGNTSAASIPLALDHARAFGPGQTGRDRAARRRRWRVHLGCCAPENVADALSDKRCSHISLLILNTHENLCICLFRARVRRLWACSMDGRATRPWCRRCRRRLTPWARMWAA